MSATAVQMATRDGRPAARGLVNAGSMAAPILLLVWLAQAIWRPGYDLSRHPMSLLALGDGGWVQTANFVVTGLLVLALARGFRLLYQQGIGRGAIPVLVAIIGVGLIASGMFPTDAGAGFPLGAPAGMPELTTIGILHEIAHAAVMASYTVVSVMLFLRFSRERDWAMLTCTTCVFIAVVAVAVVPHVESFPIRMVIAGAIPLVYLAVVAQRELRK